MTEVLRQKVCPVCGVVYSLPARLDDEHRKDGGNFYCPNGHSLVYTETELDRARARVKSLERQLELSEEAKRHEAKRLTACDRGCAAVKRQLKRSQEHRQRVEERLAACQRSRGALKGVITRLQRAGSRRP